KVDKWGRKPLLITGSIGMAVGMFAISALAFFNIIGIDFKVKEQAVHLTQESQFPFKPEVSLKVSVSTPVRMRLHIRVPDWASKPMDIVVNGKKSVTGKAGSYVDLSRTWKDGDRIDFTLPMDYKVNPYEGIDNIPGFKRYALEYGPILMAYSGSFGPEESDKSYSFDLTQLTPDPIHPLQFNIKNDPRHAFVPYWMLVPNQAFYVFPVKTPK
ncbi:hypothetical protein EZS27_038478, partial [termite gut metagenome]